MVLAKCAVARCGENRMRAMSRVRSRLLSLGCGACVLALSGCGSTASKDPAAGVTWNYASDAVILEITADPGLNQYDGQPHTLLLGFYESADAQAFRDLADDPNALMGTMATGTAPQVFLRLSRYVVAPGQHSYLILDRAQNARSIGIVAGYAKFGVLNAARQFDVPVVTKTSRLVFRTRLPGPLVVRLNLGPQGILNAEASPGGLDAQMVQRAQQVDGGGKEIRLSDSAALKPDAAGVTTGVVGTVRVHDTPLRKLAK
ncbi:type VI secretion system VasD/TssJ family lipoprotein [Paraburkholderia youngii]